MRTLLASSLLLLAACGGADDASVSPDAAPALDAATDAPAPACDVSAIPAYARVPITEQSILPSTTAAPGETIHDTLQGTLKRHYLVLPGAGQPPPTRALLWLAGSGAEPHQFTQLLTIAASAGYLGISLAYDNETQVVELCSSPTVPACNSRMNLECTDQVRREIIYGSGVSDTPCIDIPRADSIENRIVRLLQHAERQQPGLGARALLNAAGDGLAWERWAIGGWSQGGGHSGVLAADHRVARALYLSKGGDPVLCPLTTTDPDRDCDANGDGHFDPQDADELQVPSPAAYRPRMTPGERQFGIIHEREGAWDYSRDIFEVYGMGAKEDVVRIDGLGPYPAGYERFACRNVFSTIAMPGGADPNAYHVSMAVDGALALDGDGNPIIAPAVLYALTVPVP